MAATIFPLQGRRVFVAGHQGMVGSALVRRLSDEQCEILKVGRGALDLRDQSAVDRWFSEHRPDTVLLAAARVGGLDIGFVPGSGGRDVKGIVEGTEQLGEHGRVVPAAALGVVDRHHVIGVETPETGLVQDIGTYLVARRSRIAGKREFEGAIGHVPIV